MFNKVFLSSFLPSKFLGRRKRTSSEPPLDLSLYTNKDAPPPEHEGWGWNADMGVWIPPHEYQRYNRCRILGDAPLNAEPFYSDAGQQNRRRRNINRLKSQDAKPRERLHIEKPFKPARFAGVTHAKLKLLSLRGAQARGWSPSMRKRWCRRPY